MKAPFAWFVYVTDDGKTHHDTINLGEVTMKPITGTNEAIYNGRHVKIEKLTEL